MRRRRGWAAACLGVWAAACEPDAVTPPDELEPADADVALLDAAVFTPDSVTVAVGSLVRWTNGRRFHTITPDDATQVGAWVGAPVSGTGEIFEHRFDAPGVYRYHCEPHLGDGMTGVIVVQ